MLWATSNNVHLDRVASAWLILRFIDEQAEFQFVAPGEEPADGASAFSLPGAMWGRHDDEGTTFEKLAAGHGLQGDQALGLMGRMISAGVRQALRKPPAEDESPDETSYGKVLNETGVALGAIHDDAGHLVAARSIYDGVYGACQIKTLPEALRAEMPPGPPAERNAFLREHLFRTSGPDRT